MPWISLLAETLAIVLSAVILGAVAWLRRSLASLASAQEEQSERFDRRLGAVEREIVKVKDIERHDVIERVSALEVSLAGLATADNVSRIHARIDELQSDDAKLAAGIGELKGLAQSQSQQLQIIQQYLIERRD